MTCKRERWKTIPGFKGIYHISDRGRLKSFKECSNGKVLKLTNSKGDYFAITLQSKGKVRHTRIHRLVAEAFIPNPLNLPEVNHIDGNKQNNRVDNLEWCTPRQNANHAIKTNPGIVAKMNLYNQYIRPKPIIQFDKNGNRICWFISATDASKSTGVCARNILQVANRTPYNDKGHVRKSAGGYVWRFESEVI